MRRRASTRTLATEVASLAWPAIVQGLLHTAVFFTDRVLLGRYSADALGSMQISGPLLWSVFSVSGAFGAGVIAVVGRAVGAQDPERARRTVAASLAFALLMGTVVAIGGFSLRGTLATAMTEPDAAGIRELAQIYMGWVFAAAPLQVVGAAAMTALQAGGDTKTPMRVTVASGLVNLVVSYSLLFGAFGMPELGIAGSAIGTVCAFSVHGLVLLAVLRRRSGAVSLAAPVVPRWSALQPVLRISLPTLGEKLIFHTGFLFFAGIVGHLGETAMAANQSLIAIESLGFIAASGFGVAAGALVAQKLGAGRPDDAQAVGWTAAAIGVGSLSAVSLLFLALPEQLVGAFTDDNEVIALGARCLRIAALAQPLMALADVLASSLRGAGDTATPMAVALIGPVVVRLAACWLLAVELDLGLVGIWLGTTIDWSVRCVALGVVWARGRWRQLELD